MGWDISVHFSGICKSLYLYLAARVDLKTNLKSVCEAEVSFRSSGALQQITGKHRMLSYSWKRPAQSSINSDFLGSFLYILTKSLASFPSLVQ